jgi:hypothetical protein
MVVIVYGLIALDIRVLVRGETGESIASVKEILVGFEFLASEKTSRSP